MPSRTATLLSARRDAQRRDRPEEGHREPTPGELDMARDLMTGTARGTVKEFRCYWDRRAGAVVCDVTEQRRAA
jgi:hypothetical protein